MRDSKEGQPPTTWMRERTVEAAVSPEAVWRVWADLAARPRWKDISWVEFEGPLVPGATGRWKPPVVPPMHFEVIEVTPARSLVISATHIEWAATGRIEHLVEPIPGGGSRITHRVVLSGPLAKVVGGLFGRGLASETNAKRMQRLIEIAAET